MISLNFFLVFGRREINDNEKLAIFGFNFVFHNEKYKISINLKLIACLVVAFLKFNVRPELKIPET